VFLPFFSNILFSGHINHPHSTFKNMSSTTKHPNSLTVISLLLQNLGFETSCGIFQIIFSYLDPPKHYERFLLRRLCRVFRCVLKATVPSGMFTTFPHPNYPTLNGLMDVLNRVYQEDPSKAPNIVFIMKGTFHGNDARVNINYPLIMIGAGQNKTFLSGYSLRIGGKKEEGKKVFVQDMTSSGAECGVDASHGLSFLCTRMTFTQCGHHGVYVNNTKGRLINCVITHCGWSGILCDSNALIELEGSQTEVNGNGTSGSGSGLFTFDRSSRIHLLFPLTQESVSINHHCGSNYGGNVGEIAIVDDDGNTIEIVSGDEKELSDEY